MLRIIGIKESRKWAWPFIQVLFVFVFILVNTGVFLGQTNKVSSTTQVKVIDPNGLTARDEDDCTLRDEEFKPKSAKLTDYKTPWDWDWDGLTLHNTSFLSTEAVDQFGFTSGKKDKIGGSISEAEKQAQIAEAMNNPLSSLWLMFIQNDTSWYDGDILDALGEDKKVQNTTLIQPVMPFKLTEEWQSIFRPVIPINRFETVGNLNVSAGSPGSITGVDFDRKTGLGDIVLWNAFSNQYKPPFVFGFGPTVMLPTATDEQLGTGKYSAGPMALAAYIGDKWIIGGVVQHWWSFAGDDRISVNTSGGKIGVDRPNVNLTDFQYILRYRLTPTTNIGAAPNIRYNWETNQLNLPIGIGGDTLIKIGKVPVKIGAEVHYYVERDNNFGPEWMLRLYFVPVLPSPSWSKKPLF